EEKKGPGHFQGVTVQPMAPRGGLELILGLMADPQFGPVLLFGSGGSLVEIYKDRAVGLPPLNTTLARRLMEKTRIFQALADKMPEGLPGLEKLLVRFSRLAVEQPWVKEIDINPLLAGPSGFLALDARVVLHDPATPPDRLPRPAVRPYPSQYARSVALRGGEAASLRPIRPEDEPAMIKFHQSLSERTVYMRYLHPLKLSQRVSHERLARICFVDYDREMVLAAEREAGDGGREILAVGRLSRLGEAPAAEFALLVADAWQGKGLGTAMLKHLLEIAAREGLGQVVAEIHPENDAMQKICSRLGFRLARRGGAVRAEIDIGGALKSAGGKRTSPTNAITPVRRRAKSGRVKNPKPRV
ncbi:MAG: GNAT family N-acetyltransferase, partial [Elusimicrobiota bacterium]